MKPITRFFITVLLTALLVLPSASAWANTAANAKIINSADLSYSDGTPGTKHASAQVIVTVALKPAAPTITAVTDKSGPYPSPLTDDYILTNNANGPDIFILTTATNTLVNGTVSAIPVGSPISLGATVTVAGSTSDATTTTLLVPADGTSDLSINGIKKDATIVINGNERTVLSIVDNANGTSTMVVSLLPSIPGAGVVIGERTTVHATVTPTASDPLLNVTANVTMTAKSGTDTAFTATSGNVGNTFYPFTGSLTKYVRNVTTANGSGTKTTVNGVDYFKDPTVVAKPGEVLEYLLMSTALSATPLTQVVLTDLVPVDYVALSTSVVAYSSKAFRYFPDASITSGAGSSIDYTSATGDDAVDYNASFDSTVGAKKGKITAWIGGASPAYNSPGTIAGNRSIILLYQATVNP